MNKHSPLLLALLALCSIGFLGTSGAGASNPVQGADIKGVGGGRIFFGFGNFDLSAHSSADGDFGHVQETEPGVEIYVDVDCVKVYDWTTTLGPAKTAIISGIVRRVSGVIAVGAGIDVGDRETFQVDDGGEPRTDAFDAIDSFYFLFPGQDAQVDCKTLQPFVLSPDVTEGNIVVRSG
jgi:hypothetical protein